MKVLSYVLKSYTLTDKWVRLLLQVTSIITLFFGLTACSLPMAGSDWIRVRNQGDFPTEKFYWTVSYECVGSSWSLFGNGRNDSCGERNYRKRLRSNGEFKFPTAIFMTTLLDSAVVRNFSLNCAEQENKLFSGGRFYLTDFFHKKNEVFTLDLAQKTFTFENDKETAARLIETMMNNFEQVTYNSLLKFSYNLSYNCDDRIYCCFYSKNITFTLKELSEKDSISFTEFIAGPVTHNVLKEQITIVIENNNSSRPIFEYHYKKDINPDDFSNTVFLSLNNDKLSKTIQGLIVQRKANKDLWDAVKNNDHALVLKALAEGADSNCREGVNETGDPILFTAIWKNNFSIVKTLIDAGADINIKNNYGTAIEQAFRYANPRNEDKNIWNNTEKIIELLLKKGAHVEKNTELLWKSCEIHRFDYVDLLVKNGADLNNLLQMKYTGGTIALHWAAYKNDLIIIDYLVKKGAPIDIRDRSGRTALHHALSIDDRLPETDHRPVIDYFIDHGMPVNITDNYGRTYLHYIMDDDYSQLSTPMHFNAIKKLIAYGADVNALDNNQNTPLHILCMEVLGALKYSNDEFDGDKNEILPLIVDCLVQKGASVDAVNLDGNTPLHYCADRSSWNRLYLCQIAEALIKNGASVDKLTSHPYIMPGRSALHLAGEFGCFEMIILLINHGADVSLKTPQGESIFSFDKDGKIKNYLKNIKKSEIGVEVK